MWRKGVVKERLFQIASVTTQAAILRRVSHFKLQLSGRQETRRRGRRVGADQYPLRGDGAWIRLRV